MTAQKHTPERIRVAQDADGFWTCREAVSGSQEYVRADIADEMLEALHKIEQQLDYGQIDAARRLATYAIAKAEGRP